MRGYAVAARQEKVSVLTAAMTAICEIMRSSGIAKADAEKHIRHAIANGYQRGALKPSRRPRPITQLADLCSRWHLEKNFVDQYGCPKPLTWNGRSGSLLSLAVRVNGKARAKEIVADLIARKLVKKTRDGRWLPKAQIVAPLGFDDAQYLRTATMTERLLRTIIHNSEFRYRGPKLLLEVMAQVPKLPSRDLHAFRRIAKAQGLIFARAVDLWLEARNIPHDRLRDASTREVGVVAFAFADRPTEH
jgi:hypothetical protein